MNPFQFLSTRNYMKRHESSGTYLLAGPNTARFFSSYFTSEVAIPHNLGYVPLFRMYYEPFQNGELFEAFQDTQYYFTNPINTYGGSESGPTLLAWADEYNVYARLYFPFNTLNASTFPIHAVIYQDYGANA